MRTKVLNDEERAACRKAAQERYRAKTRKPSYTTENYGVVARLMTLAFKKVRHLS